MQNSRHWEESEVVLKDKRIQVYITEWHINRATKDEFRWSLSNPSRNSKAAAFHLVRVIYWSARMPADAKGEGKLRLPHVAICAVNPPDSTCFVLQGPAWNHESHLHSVQPLLSSGACKIPILPEHWITTKTHMSNADRNKVTQTRCDYSLLLRKLSCACTSLLFCLVIEQKYTSTKCTGPSTSLPPVPIYKHKPQQMLNFQDHSERFHSNWVAPFATYIPTTFISCLLQPSCMPLYWHFTYTSITSVT